MQTFEDEIDIVQKWNKFRLKLEDLSVYQKDHKSCDKKELLIRLNREAEQKRMMINTFEKEWKNKEVVARMQVVKIDDLENQKNELTIRLNQTEKLFNQIVLR